MSSRLKNDRSNPPGRSILLKLSVLNMKTKKVEKVVTALKIELIIF